MMLKVTTTQSLELCKHDNTGLHVRANKHDALFRRLELRDGVTVRTLDWKECGTNIGSLYYTIRGEMLSVFGDLHGGIYVWNGHIGWKWLSGLSIDHFSYRCCAGAGGSGALTWDREVAYISVWRLLGELARGADDYVETFNKIGVELWVAKKMDLSLRSSSCGVVHRYIRGCCDHQITFNQMLLDHEELFGSVEHDLGSLGMAVCVETRMHLSCLHYAMQRVRDKAWAPVFGTKPDYNIICCTHDGDVPRRLLNGSHNWISTSVPSWVKSVEDQSDEETDAVAPEGGRSEVGST